MYFWAYMLQCRGGYLYIGHTDDLTRRIAQHTSGALPGLTREYLPITLVWSQEFSTRDEAKAAEKRIKGWSRARKLALIGGGWDNISQLAKKKSTPSTSSGWAGLVESAGLQRRGEPTPHSARREPVEGLCLLEPHPDTSPQSATEIRARITALTENWLTLRWSIAGASKVILPPFSGNHRADNLWHHTCFELFLQTPGTKAYIEFNLSPSENWAAYDFTHYRAGMTERAMPRPPDCTARVGHNTLIFDAAIPTAALPPRPWRIAMTAVIEETGGLKSYWAATHPPGRPDFHHPSCRTLTVPAPPAP